jgi:hypothetical protein
MRDTYPLRNPDAAWRVIDGEGVIVTPKDGLVRVLNETGARIWELSDGKATAGRIADTLAAEWGRVGAELKQDVEAFLVECSAKGLVTLRDEPLG